MRERFNLLKHRILLVRTSPAHLKQARTDEMLGLLVDLLSDLIERLEKPAVNEDEP